MTPHTLARLTLGEAIDGHRAGTLSDLEYDAYRRAWAIAGGLERGYRHAAGYGPAVQFPPEVEELAAALVAAARRGRDRLPFESAA